MKPIKDKLTIKSVITCLRWLAAAPLMIVAAVLLFASLPVTVIVAIEWLTGIEVNPSVRTA